MNLISMFKALQAGQELAEPKVWKDRQTTLNLCMVVLTGTVAALRIIWPNFPITDDQLIDYATVAATILALANGYLTTATSKKVGV